MIHSLLQGFVELPDNVKLGISGVIVWAVSWLFVQLFLLVPFLKKILDGFQTPLAMAISAALIGLIQKSTPDNLGKTVVLALQLVLSILALFGVGEELRKRNVRLFRPWR